MKTGNWKIVSLFLVCTLTMELRLRTGASTDPHRWLTEVGTRQQQAQLPPLLETQGHSVFLLITLFSDTPQRELFLTQIFLTQLFFHSTIFNNILLIFSILNFQLVHLYRKMFLIFAKTEQRNGNLRYIPT